MPQKEITVEILSPPEAVWRVLSDPTFIPKLYQDAVTVELDPPGRVAVGQKCTVLARISGVRVVIAVRFTAVEKDSLLASQGLPGGLFESFRHVVKLRALGLGATEAKVSFNYVVAQEYAKKMPDVTGLEVALGANFATYARNLKDLAELIPLPE